MSDVLDDCTGACCAVFTIGDVADPASWDSVVDGPYIRDMLIPLTREEALERAERFGAPLDQADPTPGWSPHTCRHFDDETRLCTAYEQRPKMCRDYPYASGCHHGCGFCSAPSVVNEYTQAPFDKDGRRAARDD